MPSRSTPSKPPRRALLTLLVIGWNSWPAALPHVSAQASAEQTTRTAARQLGEEGIEALLDGQVASAEERLDRAYRLFATPTLGLWSARARVRAGHLVEAAERYREAVQTSAEVGNVAAQQAAQQDAARELEALVPRIPSLTLQLDRVPAQPIHLTLDGVALPEELLGLALRSNPGAHVCAASMGAKRFERSFTLEEGQRLVLPILWLEQPVETSAREVPRLQLQAAAASSPANVPARGSHVPSGQSLKTAAVVSMSAGAAGLVVSGITALLARGKLDDCRKAQGEYTCAPDANAASYERLRTGSAVAFYAGLGLAAAGLTAFLLAPSSSDGVTWNVGPGGLQVQARF